MMEFYNEASERVMRCGVRGMKLFHLSDLLPGWDG